MRVVLNSAINPHAADTRLPADLRRTDRQRDAPAVKRPGPAAVPGVVGRLIRGPARSR